MFHWPLQPGVATRGHWERRGGPRSVGFASARGGGRLHAACDLMVPAGTAVHAISDGEVVRFRRFFHGTYQLVVRHTHPGLEPFLVRYGEVRSPDDGGLPMRAGTAVAGGDLIARVGRLRTGASMLHFELFATVAARPSLSIAEALKRDPDSYSQQERATIRTRGWHWDFQRRLDLADPTDFLLAIRDGRMPAQPTPYTRAAPTVYHFAPHRVAPSDGFLRHRALMRARMRQQASEAAYEDWLEQEGRLYRRGSARRPGPDGHLPFGDRRRGECVYAVERRRGPL